MEEGFPVKRTTEVLDLDRSLYYYHQNKTETQEPLKRGRPVPGFSLDQQGVKVPDEQIEEFLMEAVEDEIGMYGYRKLTHFLQKEHQLIINHKKVYRLCDKLNILLPQREKQTEYPRRLAQNHVITGSNQLWQLDIKYGAIENSDRFFFLASAIDVFDRCIVGYYRGSTCKAIEIIPMLQQAFMKREIHLLPEDEQLIIRTDNGPQFVSNHFGALFVKRIRSIMSVFRESHLTRMPTSSLFIAALNASVINDMFSVVLRKRIIG
ncbi:IS3 family transposase [Bacillus sp. Marseille-Q3570]|uniref:IS3 family transposase n=1 Tax=Bacillus sp. Marseille-Q3570 TaxID=2963522 RepID=UPI0021B74E87|nr:DDE-type integrase/transposase/recombinase [Bacillus sp. Marseille-Q3570]